MKRALRVRLAVLMFLQYASLGIWLPLLMLWLGALGLGPLQTALVWSTGSVGALVGPMVIGPLADRRLGARHSLALCYVGAALLLVAFSWQTHFTGLFLIGVAYWVLSLPTAALTNSVAFHHLPNAREAFGPIRMWGTVGWVTAGLLSGWVLSWDRPVAAGLADCIRLGALLSLAVGVFCVVGLPHTPATPSTRRFPALDTNLLRRHRSLAVFLLTAFCVGAAAAYANQLTAPLLRDRGLAPAYIGPLLTLGQASEVVSLLALPLLLRLCGMKTTLLIGITAWCSRYLLLASSTTAAAAVASLAFHGLGIGCFYVACQIYIDGEIGIEWRSSAQAIMSLVTSGVGSLAGNLLTGWTVQHFEADYQRIFLGPGLMLAVVAVLFGLRFQETASPAPAPLRTGSALPELS